MLMLGLLVAAFASAQAAGAATGGPFGTAGPTIPPQWGHWSDWTVGPTQPTSTGIERSGTGNAEVKGVKVPMAAKWTATKTAVSVAGAAAAAACTSTLIGAVACQAAAQYAVYKGIEKCLEYEWCRPATQQDLGYPPGYKWKPQTLAQYYDGPEEACGAMGFGLWRITGINSAQCSKANGDYSGFIATRVTNACATGYHMSGSNCVPDNPSNVPKLPSPPPYDDPGFIPWLNDWQGNSPRNGPDLAQDASDRGYPPELTASPDVSGQPGTGPTVTTTEERPKPDGSTDHVTRDTTTTVTPNITNNQTTNVTVTYTSNTTTTTNVTNNTTGTTTTTTETTTDPGARPEPPRLEIPNDYNKEVTQQQVLKELAGDAAPPAPPDQGQLVENAKTQAKTDLDALRTAAETLDKDPWFSWVWTPPTGSCSAFAGEVHGFQISWDFCPTVENIREVLGWLFAIFAAIEIYGQLFRREG